MKFFKLIFFSIIFGCTIFTSCKSNVSTTNQLASIPGDATIVFEIKGNEIFAKSGLNSPDNYTFFNIMKKFIGADASYFLESLLKGSSKAGISAEKILFYMTKMPEYTLTVPVVNKTAFENWLKKTGAPDPTDEGKLRYISINDNFRIAWSDKLVIISGASAREKIAEQFDSKDNGLLAVSSDFQQFATKSADIRFWFKYSAFADLYKTMKSLNPNLTDRNDDKLMTVIEDFANISIHSYLNFEDGKIAGNASIYPPEEINKIKEKYPLFKNDFNSIIIKDMPEQSFLAFNMSVNVKEYFKTIRESIENMLSNDIYMPGIAEKKNELFKFLDSPELKSVIDALGGDILFSIHGFNNGMLPYPLVSTSFTVNGESAFNDILNLIPKDLYKKYEDYYVVTTSKIFIPLYFAYKDNRVFVSVDSDAIKTFTGKPTGKTFADNPISKIMTDKMVFYINLDYAAYPNNIKMLLQNTMGTKYGIFTSVIDIYECMYFTGDAGYNSEFSLQFKNKKVNSLKQILKNMDKTFSSLWTN
jgi:hypothetical protein